MRLAYIDHTSNSVIKSLLGQLACLIGGVENLIVEDGEVQGKTKADGVGRSKVGGSNVGSSLVGFEGLVCRSLALVSNSKLGEVTMIITLPAWQKMIREISIIV